jgi:glutathione S-transferase
MSTACCSQSPEKKTVPACCGTVTGAACCGPKACSSPCSTSTGGCCDLANMKLKLVYFNTTGRAELIRWMLAHAKAPFEDVRVANEWAQIKKNYPTEQLPILEYVDPKTNKPVHMVQSSTIVRAVAGFTGLVGHTANCVIEADQAYECLRDVLEAFYSAMSESNAERKEELLKKVKTDIMPRMLGYLEKKIKDNNGKFLTGNAYTYGDYAIATFVDWFNEHSTAEEKTTFEKTYPTLSTLAKTIRETPEIKAYLAKRPASEKC